MPPLARQLQWLIAIRLIVVTSITVPYFLLATLAPAPPDVAMPTVPVDGGVPLPPPPDLQPAESAPPATPVGAIGPSLVYRLAGITYLASLVYLALLRFLRRRPTVHAYVQFFGDLLIVTALVWATGGANSPLSLFYLIVIAIASTLLGRAAGFTVATVAYALYAGTLLALYQGWLPGDNSEATLFRLAYNLAVNLFAFYAVALLTWMLSTRAVRAERELEARSEDLADLEVVHRDVIQSITSGLATTDPVGRITSLNRAGEEILMIREAEMVGTPIQSLVGQERWAGLIVHPSAPGEPLRSEIEVQVAGEPAFLGLSVSRLTDAGGEHRGYNVVFQDLTSWRQLEQEVRMKERMAAVGELAAGIAHEIGNPLAAISGSVQLLSSSFRGDEDQAKLLRILLKESQRLDRTIKGFLRFAKPPERSTLRFDIGALLAENYELLRNSPEVAPHHRLELVLEPRAVELVADPDQVSQIFWNLARNALKAMPAGGSLRVVGLAIDGAYRIRFEDTGRGMRETQRANLFHPFQSFFDSGTGIGMAIVYRIVEEHSGRIEVESAEGRGTTITVELPRPAAAAVAEGL
jgi:two-component system sensor histidine kinase PilS (NtrC family)